MKRLYIIAALAVATLTANAQEKLTLSTYNGTNVETYDGKTCNVTVNRYVFTGWNTIALPFNVTVDELNDIFGNDCKLERLVSVENVGNDIQLNFQDCKAQGISANTPYILYYTGESMNKKIAKEATISYGEPTVSFKTRIGETVTMAGVQKMTKGIGFYGILARDNSEAKWTKVDASLSGFLATRCCIQLNSTTAEKLITNHIGANEVSSIHAIARNNELVDVYNVNGQKVAAQVNANQVNSLQPGIYVVKGQKVLVK